MCQIGLFGISGHLKDYRWVYFCLNSEINFFEEKNNVKHFLFLLTIT